MVPLTDLHHSTFQKTAAYGGNMNDNKENLWYRDVLQEASSRKSQLQQPKQQQQNLHTVIHSHPASLFAKQAIIDFGSISSSTGFKPVLQKICICNGNPTATVTAEITRLTEPFFIHPKHHKIFLQPHSYVLIPCKV